MTLGCVFVGLLTPMAASAPLAGTEGSTLGREPQLTPQEIGDGSAADLLYGDPTEGLSLMAPPEGSPTGSAHLDYPLVLPKGRGMTPELALSYESGGGSTWAGLGWDLSVGDVSVDTGWGVPLFCPRDTGPKCGNVESESYSLDGEALQPSAVRSSYLPRIAEREDFTRRVETEYQRIIRHGTSPSNYFWEVVDKEGAIRWYGAYPDEGGPYGKAGTRKSGRFENDKKRNPSAILTDGVGSAGNGFRWYLSAERDVGVNFFRYEYDTVTYQSGSSSDNGTAWQAIPDGQACGSGRTCAKHVYLERILYTGAGEASGHDEDPAYEVDFIRATAHRPDPVLDARGGFLDLDQERLTNIEVRFRETNELVTRYDLEYSPQPDRYGKSRLLSVTQIGCAGGTKEDCDMSTAAKHTFTYYDDVATAGGGFAAAAKWDGVKDGLNAGHQIDRASALGMSETNGGDGRVYIGFNPTSPTKTGSFGGSITFNGGRTESLIEFTDINGDALPDKIFRSGNQIKYRLNTSKPGDALNKEITFSTADDGNASTTDGVIANLTKLPAETEFGLAGGIEAYFGIVGVFNVGGAWSFSDGYFTDANGDGLVDFVQGGRVLFNHLDCSRNDDKLDSADKCIPTFSEQSTDTRVPLTVGASQSADDSAAQTLQMLRELAPPVDTVRRWVAPFSGTITIGGTAKLLAAPQPGDTVGTQPVRVAVQYNGIDNQFQGVEKQSSTLIGVGAMWTPTIAPFHVNKGERIYFRASSRADGRGDDVEWDPTVTYAGLASADKDVNGLRQDFYKSSEDFTITGRPGSVVTLPNEGTARFTAGIEKGKTTDDIAPQLQVLPLAGGNPRSTDVDITPVDAGGVLDPQRVKSVAKNGNQWCVTDPSGGDFGCFPTEVKANERLHILGAAEVGRFRLSAHFHIDATSNNKTDAVQTWLGVDSPIDAQQITWKEQPLLCYPDVSGNCDTAKPKITPPVDLEIYPKNNLDGPVAPWTSTRGKVESVEVKLDVGANNDAGNVFLTIKKRDGYIYKESFGIGASGVARTFEKTDLPGLDLTSGEKYWVDLSVRNLGLSDKLSNPHVTFTWTEQENGKDVKKTVSPPVTLNWVGQQGYFPVSYRGWGIAGYRSEGTRATTVIEEDDFNPGPAGGGTFDNKDDACDAQPGGCKDENDVNGMGFAADYPVDSSGMAQVDLSSARNQIPKAFAYVPTLSAALAESWQVVGDPPRLLGTATTFRSARLGDVPAALASGGGGLSAPSLWGATGPAFSIMAGVGPLAASFGFGWSSSVLDYMDMNGDGFPDVVTPTKITYTNPRGARTCVSGGSTIDCDGDTGAEVVQQSTTIGVNAGLGGAPIGFSNNSKGRTNATQGNSGNKGGPAADKEYGGGLGLSLGFDATWTNPNSADPAWSGEKKIDAVPGEPRGAGLATEQVLADVNGDGLPDRIIVDPQGVFVKLNLGYKFSAKELQWSAGGFESAESYSGSVGGGFSFNYYEFAGGVSGASGVDFARYAWVDVNGDGLLDALHKDEPNHRIDVAFGTGIGIGTEQTYGTMASLPFNVFPGVPTDLSGQQIRQDVAQSVGGGVDVTIGIPLCAVACYLIVNPGGHFTNSLSASDIDLQDVNGDGAADSVSRRPAEDGNHEKLDVRLNTRGRTGLLETVTTPMRGTITLGYSRVGNTLEHPDSDYVLSDVRIHSSRRTDGSDGVVDQRSTYEYGKQRFAFVQREDLGFDKLVMRQLDPNGTVLRSIEHRYLNNSVFDSGLETSTTLYDGDISANKKKQKTDTDWKVLNLATNLPLTLEGVDTDALLRLRAAPQIEGTTETLYDANGAVGQENSIRYTYDRLGNPTLINDRGDPTNPDDDVVAKITYSDCKNAASYDLDLFFGCSEGLPSPDPDDPDTADPVPAKTPPAAAAPYWSKDLCPTYTSVPVIIEVRDSKANLMRYRDGSPDVCDNTSVTDLKEKFRFGTSLDDPTTFAETFLTYDNWGSYNRIVYPEDDNGKRYSVFYTWDEKRQADIADVKEFSLEDEDQVNEFLDPTALGELTDDIDASETSISVLETSRTAELPALPFEITIGDETLRVTNRTATSDDDRWIYTVVRGVEPPAPPLPPTPAAFAQGEHSDVALVEDPGNPSSAQEAMLEGLTDAGVAGITSSATFDGPTGRVSSRKDANDNVTTYTYDAFSRTKKITFADGGSASFEYAPTNATYPYAVAHNSDEFNADPIDTATFVDGSGRITSQKRDATFFVGPNNATKTGWAVGGATQLDALGRTITEWYPTQQLTGALTDFVVSKPPETESPPIKTEWDALDRVTKETASNGSETKTTYGFGTLDGKRYATTEIEDPQHRKTATYNDVRDMAHAVDDIAVGLGSRRTDYDVDALGQVHSVRSSPNEVTTHEYDLLGQRLATTTPDGGRVTFTYDLAGNLTSKQTPVLRSHDDEDLIEYGYDFGHLVSTHYPESANTADVEFKWGGYGDVDGGDNGNGRIVDIVDAARHQELGYDKNGRVDTETTTMFTKHPNNGPFTTKFDYDWLGRLGSVSLPDGETVTNDYDAGGRLSNVQGAKSCTALGSLAVAIDATQTTLTVNENPNTGAPALPFTIRIDKEQLQVTARVATGTPNQWAYTVVRGINGTPLTPTNVSHGAGARITSDTPITCVYRYLDRREYDVFGSRAYQAVGNGVSTQYTRDLKTRLLTGQVTTSPAAPFEIQDLVYGYDLVGNLTSADNNLPADVSSLFGGPSHQGYIYDKRYRLTHGDGTWDYAPKTRRSYTYDTKYDDVTGNMTFAKQRDWTQENPCRGKCPETEISKTTYDQSTITYETGGVHRYDVVGAQSPASSRNYDHDLDGNVTRVETFDNIREVTWNAEDKMATIVDRNKNAGGRKVTSYFYDYNGNLALEEKEQGFNSYVNPWVTIRDGTMWKHIWADGERLASKFSQANDYEDKVYFLHKDLQGGTNVATDRVGKVFQHHEYFPTGEVWVDESSTVFRTPYQFTGGYTDEDHSLVDMGQRWYEPRAQAFFSADPVLVDDPSAIQNEPELRSSYAYARNNPTSYIDTDGRLFESVKINPLKAMALALTLQIDGKPASMEQRSKVSNFFAKHQGLRGRMGLYWLSRQEDSEGRKATADRLDTKPVLEFEFENGKLKAIKLGFGVGKRKKFDFSTPQASTPTQKPAGQQTQAPAGQQSQTTASTNSPNPAPSNTGTASTSAPTKTSTPTGGGSTASTPQHNTQSSAGGGAPAGSGK